MTLYLIGVDNGLGTLGRTWERGAVVGSEGVERKSISRGGEKE